MPERDHGMKLESGPAATDRNWHIARAILFLGFAAYFLYDGSIGYPNKNRKEAEKWLQAPQPIGGQVSWGDLKSSPTLPEYEKLQAANPRTREEVHRVLGQPAFVVGSDEYFMSWYGRGKITYAGDSVTAVEPWHEWYKSREEIRIQFYCAIIAALPGLYFLWRMFKAMTLRVVIDDKGMDYGGQRIPFEAMVSLQDYSPKGWIDLYYMQDDAKKKLRLDNQKVRLFDEIVEAISEAKGFENAVKAHAEEQRERRAAEERAAAAEEADRDSGEGG
jgi:hypothetical protein